MYGGRITGEEKSTLSTYVAIGVAVALTSGALYFFFLAQHQKNAVKGFDPNRPMPTDAVLKERLTSEQFSVVRQNGSQTPFQNEYWNNDRTGIYVDLITGEPLFISIDKYDCGVGIPTFSKPISKDLLVEKLDTSNEMQRTEVRAKRSEARLGYLFPDPKSPTGQRYVIYSAALHFVPVEKMPEDGYERYLPLVRKK
ncbi:MAG: peptide-methionine (R)-S-oxide reductase MsrB [Chthoniobacterales bacterium]